MSFILVLRSNESVRFYLTLCSPDAVTRHALDV